jgi:CRISPR-associated protein Cmr2
MLMRKIIGQIKSSGSEENIQIPYAKGYPELESSIGLYSDRLLYKGEISGIESIIDKAIGELASLMIVKHKDSDKMKGFLKEYLQIYHFCTTEEELNKVPGSNYIAQLDFVLNSLELESKILSAANKRKISTFLKRLSDTLLYTDYFKKDYKDRTKSLVEIATVELSECEEYKTFYNELLKKYIDNEEKIEEKQPEDIDYQFIEDLQNRIKEERKKEEGDTLLSFKNHHKYVAVIYADGDRMGKLIGKAIELEGIDIHDISNALFEWSKEASEVILQFGGLPVYAGGDDLLCFTPIVNGEEHIISTLKEVSRIFTQKFIDLFRDKVSENYKFPTLSFGVSIAYYKYPLNESINAAHDLLYEMKNKGGNGICMKMLKHSGSDFDFVLPLEEGNKILTIFESLMQSEMTESMISSAAYHLQNNVKVIDGIAGRDDRINNFFINRMEGYPEEDNESHYLKQVELLVCHAFKNEKTDADGNYINRMLPVYDMLRIVKFIKGLDKTD